MSASTWASEEEEESTFIMVESNKRKKENKKTLKEVKQEETISKKPAEVVAKISPVPPTPFVDVIDAFTASIEESEMEIAIEKSKLVELEAEQAALTIKIKEFKQSICAKEKRHEENDRIIEELFMRMKSRNKQSTPVQVVVPVQVTPVLNADAPVFVPVNDFPALPVSKPREKVVIKRPTASTKETKVQEPPVPVTEEVEVYPFVKIGDKYQDIEHVCGGYTFIEKGVKKTYVCKDYIYLSGAYIARKIKEYPNYVPQIRCYDCRRHTTEYFSKKQ